MKKCTYNTHPFGPCDECVSKNKECGPRREAAGLEIETEDRLSIHAGPKEITATNHGESSSSQVNVESHSAGIYSIMHPISNLQIFSSSPTPSTNSLKSKGHGHIPILHWSMTSAWGIDPIRKYHLLFPIPLRYSRECTIRILYQKLLSDKIQQSIARRTLQARHSGQMNFANDGCT